MPARLRLPQASLAIRPRIQRPTFAQPWTRRSLADDAKSQAQSQTTSTAGKDAAAGLHPNPSVSATTDPVQKEQQKDIERDDDPRAGAPLHVSEEAAAMAKSMGTQPPELDKGIPVSEAVKNDPEAFKNLPKVMQDALKQNSGQKRSYSTSARRLQSLTSTEPGANVPAPPPNMHGQPLTLRQLASQRHEIDEATALAIAQGELPDPVAVRKEAELRAREPFKFGEPVLPLPAGSNMRKDRYDDVVEFVTCLIMRHGKKSLAQKNMSEILAHLRTSPAPRPSPTRPLLPTAPPVEQLPLNPVLYLTLAIDSVAPLLRIRSLRGAAGGGAALPIPMPLNLRQRRRAGFMWILEAVDKKKGSTSGFAKRVAEEVIAVIEGRSSAWEKRSGLHRLGLVARANLNYRTPTARR